MKPSFISETSLSGICPWNIILIFPTRSNVGQFCMSPADRVCITWQCVHETCSNDICVLPVTVSRLNYICIQRYKLTSIPLRATTASTSMLHTSTVYKLSITPSSPSRKALHHTQLSIAHHQTSSGTSSSPSHPALSFSSLHPALNHTQLSITPSSPSHPALHHTRPSVSLHHTQFSVALHHT